MYYPYLKGRQFELLAIKELLERSLISPLVVPIIEPIKASSTLCNTLQTYAECVRPIVPIWHSASEEFYQDFRTTSQDGSTKRITDKLHAFIQAPSLMKGIEITKNSKSIITRYENDGFARDQWVVLCREYDMLNYYQELFASMQPQCVIIPDDSPFRRSMRKVANRILIDDKFQKQTRNSDYIKNDDEFFSEDHLYFASDGYKGFSDYSIVGDYDAASGFAPKAVAIHIVYIDKNDQTLRIHHFVSDSNEDIRNTAKKFYEATQKLFYWVETEKPEITFGLNAFLEHYQNGTYPGLGVVKKLSIMHHLELMSRHLTEDGWK